MALQTEVTFHEVQHSDALEASIQRWASRLEHVHERLVGCQVTVGYSPAHSPRGRAFEVRVKVDADGNVIVGTGHHDDVYLAVADAFRAARRLLLDELGVRPGKARPPFVTHYITPH